MDGAGTLVPRAVAVAARDWRAAAWVCGTTLLTAATVSLVLSARPTS